MCAHVSASNLSRSGRGNLVEEGKMWGEGHSGKVAPFMSVFMECMCPIYCKPRCNPEQEAGQGVTVGVKAPLLP